MWMKSCVVIFVISAKTYFCLMMSHFLDLSPEEHFEDQETNIPTGLESSLRPREGIVSVHFSDLYSGFLKKMLCVFKHLSIVFLYF